MLLWFCASVFLGNLFSCLHFHSECVFFQWDVVLVDNKKLIFFYKKNPTRYSFFSWWNKTFIIGFFFLERDFSNSCSFVTSFSWLFQMLCVPFFPLIYVRVFLACWVLHDFFFFSAVPCSSIHLMDSILFWVFMTKTFFTFMYKIPLHPSTVLAWWLCWWLALVCAYVEASFSLPFF